MNDSEHMDYSNLFAILFPFQNFRYLVTEIFIYYSFVVSIKYLEGIKLIQTYLLRSFLSLTLYCCRRNKNNYYIPSHKRGNLKSQKSFEIDEIPSSFQEGRIDTRLLINWPVANILIRRPIRVRRFREQGSLSCGTWLAAMRTSAMRNGKPPPA